MQKELIPHHISTLEEAYSLVQELDQYVRPPAPCSFDNRRGEARPGMSTNRTGSDEQPSRENPNTLKHVPSSNQSKEIVGNKPQGDQNRCFRCGGVGHKSLQYPNKRNKNLYLGNTMGGDKRNE